MNKTKIIAKNYINEMIELHGCNYKALKKAILENCVNSRYVRASNLEITYIWDEFNKKFK
jgi:hypothetical protein